MNHLVILAACVVVVIVLIVVYMHMNESPPAATTYTIASIDPTNATNYNGTAIGSSFQGAYTPVAGTAGQFKNSSGNYMLIYSDANYYYGVMAVPSDLTTLSSKPSGWFGGAIVCLNPDGSTNPAGITYQVFAGLTAGTNVSKSTWVATQIYNANKATNMVCTATAPAKGSTVGTVAFTWTAAS